MAKVRSLTEAMEKYKGGGNNDFFSLENDKDSTVGRFLHGGEEDLLEPGRTWWIVHEVTIDGKKRWVLCTEEEDCPLCLSGNHAKLRLFLQLVDKRDGKVKTWERGQTFATKLLGLVQRYGALHNRPYEIQRNGKKGDTNTSYELYPLDPDNKPLNELPEKQELVGTLIINASHEDMQKIVSGTYKLATNNSGANTATTSTAGNVTPRSSSRAGSDVF